MNKRHLRIFLIALFITIIITTIILLQPWKKDISNATYQELEAIKGIGKTLATRITAQCTYRNVAGVDDLYIIGLGTERKKLLKKYYR